jgi:hypothetical protein
VTHNAVPEPEDPGPRDWRIWLGLTLTAIWLILGFHYVLVVVGWSSFIREPAAALGGFLEGAFAPLAFLWLVIGFFLQQKELSQNTRAIRSQYVQMRKTADQAEIQARAISANELHQHQETFLQVAEIVRRQLGATVGMLYMSSQGPAGSGAIGIDGLGVLWERLGQGDPEVFSRALLGLHFTCSREESRDLFWGTPVRTRHSQSIIRTFERLLDAARSCDPQGIITDALLGAGHGTLYRVILEVRDESQDVPA